MTFSDLSRRVAEAAVKNSPHVLTAIGVVGTATTAYLSGKAAWQASDIIRLKEADDEQRGVMVPSPKELLKQRIELVFPLFVPPILVGAATMACIIGADRVSASRAAAIATGYTILERNFSDHKAKVLETIGERKAEGIRDAVAQDRITKVEEDTYIDDARLTGLQEGELCYDMFLDRFFRSSVELMKAAENDTNFRVIHDGTATLADFYRDLGLEVPPVAERLGWNSDRKMEVRIGGAEMHGKAVLTMDFRDEPLPDFGRSFR